MKLLFDRDDVEDIPHTKEKIQDTPDLILVRLLRRIMYLQKVTLNDFFQLYQTYGRQSNWSQEEIRSMHHNDRRSILSPTSLTIYIFIRIVFSILRLDVVNISVILSDPITGKRTIYHSSDSVDET